MASYFLPPAGCQRFCACSTALEAALPAQLDCGLVLVWVYRRCRCTVFNLASENVTDQFSKLDGVAWALEAISCHNRSMPRFWLTAQSGEIETVPLPRTPSSGRLSCRKFDHNAVRLQLHALAYNLGNFMRTLALPDSVEQWSLTTLREKLIKIGAKIVRHGRYVIFQMAEVAIPRDLFADILRRIDRLRPTRTPA